MYYVYLLKSLKDNRIYIGYTSDLRHRIEEHKNKGNYTTAKMLPIELVYYEAYRSEDDARKREKSLKYHGKALTQLKKRIINSSKVRDGESIRQRITECLDLYRFFGPVVYSS